MKAPRLLGPALVGAALALVLAGVARWLVPGALLAGVLAVQGGVAVAWLSMAGTGRLGEAVAVSAVAAVVADVVAFRHSGTRVADLVVVPALALPVVIGRELARRERRDVTVQVAATVGAVALVVLTAPLLSVRAATDGAVLAGTALAAVATTSLCRSLRSAAAAEHPHIVGTIAGFVAALLIGAALGATWEPLSAAESAGYAAVVAIAALVAARGVELAADGVGPGRRRAATRPLAVVLPIAVAAPVAYATARLLAG